MVAWTAEKGRWPTFQWSLYISKEILKIRQNRNSITIESSKDFVSDDDISVCGYQNISAWNGRFSRVQWSLYIRKYWKSEKIAITLVVGCGRDDHIFWKTGCRNYLQTWHNYRSVRSTRIKLRSWREKGNVSQFDRLGGVRVCAFDWSFYIQVGSSLWLLVYVETKI